MAEVGGAPLGAGGRAFERLGRAVVRHPGRPVVVWIVLLVAGVPLLLHLGTATQNSASSVPSSAPSSLTAAETARLFPASTSASSSLLLFTGANVTGPTGQAAVLAATRTLADDPHLSDVASITSVYSAYDTFLEGQTDLALLVLDGTGVPSDELPQEAGTLSALLWGPPASFYGDWESNVSSHPGTDPASFNFPVFESVNASLSASPGAQEVLDGFYYGVPGATAGFNASASRNGTGDCASDPSTALVCADTTARLGGASLLPVVLPPNASAEAPVLGAAVLADLALSNASDPAGWASAAAHAVATGSGLSYPWVERVWSAFPNGSAPATSVTAWATAIADGPVAAYPLPIPPEVRHAFVDRSDDATLVVVDYSVDDSATTASGADPDFSDVAEIDRVVPPVVAAAAPGGTVGFVQTGPAPLDADENSVLEQNLATVLPLTLVILVLITIAYFRSPLAPAVTFGALGVAIGLGLAGLVGLSMLFGKVDPTAVTLENTFVLGVGTDYSIFLVARYREELRKGVPSDDAIVTSVTWAGQSIATSGGTAVLATLALAFSGVKLLSQWGETLSLAVALTVLVALTLVPALLKLLGPRVFWPETGAKATAAAERHAAAIAGGSTYFQRAGRLAQRRPLTVLAVVLLVSAPLVYVAVVAPLSYDFYEQLPRGTGASAGLSELGDRFGAGTAFPTEVLLTFPAPLVSAGTLNVTEFAELADVTDAVNRTAGVASVTSPVGPYGAPLPAWIGFGAAAPGTQQELLGTLDGYLGSDGRTVRLVVVPTSSGLSAAAVDTLGSIRSAVADALARDGASGVSVAYGGGAPVISDLAAQTATATLRMILAVVFGLLVVLYAVLRSALIPPMAVATILLSIGWAWGTTQLLFADLLGLPLFFFVPTVLFILILGLGIDYNIFLLTRVREERLRGRDARAAVLEAVTRTGGIITAAAVILGGAFAALSAGDFVLLKAIGFSVAAAVILDAMIVRTYLVPSALNLLGDRVWGLRAPRTPKDPSKGSPPPAA